MAETYVKYDRFSKIYDLVERGMERKNFSKWRKMIKASFFGYSKIINL